MFILSPKTETFPKTEEVQCFQVKTSSKSKILSIIHIFHDLFLNHSRHLFQHLFQSSSSMKCPESGYSIYLKREL